MNRSILTLYRKTEPPKKYSTSVRPNSQKTKKKNISIKEKDDGNMSPEDPTFSKTKVNIRGL